MAQSIADILNPLRPHWDRIARLPLSKAEIKEIERGVGLKMPAALRDWLSMVGLFQDLTHDLDSSIELFDDPSDFISNREFLVSLKLRKTTDLFPFGHDGMGNLFALPVAEDQPCIILVDHATRRLSRKKPFLAWLEKIVQRVLRRIKHRTPNDRKAWCVQFTFEDVSFGELVDALSENGRIQVTNSRWKCVERTTRAKVGMSQRQILLAGKPLTICHSKCPNWDMLYFDMDEPLAKMMKNSTIRRLHALFKQRFQNYKLVNYGPLDMDDLEVK